MIKTLSGNEREEPVHGSNYWVKFKEEDKWEPVKAMYVRFYFTDGGRCIFSSVYDFLPAIPPSDEPIIATGIAEGPNGIDVSSM